MDEVTPRRRIAPSAVLWLLLGAAYFLIPLIATFVLSVRSDQTGKCCTFANYSYILNDPSSGGRSSSASSSPSRRSR